MKRILLLALLAIGIQAAAQFPVLNIGAQLPEAGLTLKDTNGKTTTLNDQKRENGLLVIFSCNTCPFVVAWEDRYPVVNELSKNSKVGFVLVNSNENKRNDDDSVDAMKAHAAKHKYVMPYLIDVDSKLANAFGAQTTPHVFLFDKNGKLVYKGAIDDNYKNASEVKEFYLKDALADLAAGKEIKTEETRNLGCSIKRK